MRSRSAGKWGTVFLVAGLAGVVRADITVEQQVNVDGFGPSKFGALEGKNTTAISGDRARTQQQSQFKSKLLRVLAKGSSTDTVRIIRLDAERIDEIDNTNKQYTETTFQQMRDAAASAVQSARNAPAAQQQEAPSGAPVDESKCQWSPPKAELKQTGEHASVAGADASRATITVTTTCTDATKGTSCDFVFVLDEWLAADIPGTAETREFWANYAKKLDLGGVLAQTMQANSQAVFQRYQSGWGEALKQAGSLKGYPVKSVYAMQFGGPQCKSADSSSSGTAGGNGGTGSGSDNAGSNSVPTSPSAAVGSVAMGLFNKLHKKSDSQEAAPAPVAPGMVQLFQMSAETVAFRTDAIPSALFEVPAGYKKVDKPLAPQ
ncbi:MAG TPA: hypothetical protein VN757_11410 [Steroidobacteraceae bacterium]|nr:hypothetical protein [Steroidobacteraceae bacterium]